MTRLLAILVLSALVAVSAASVAASSGAPVSLRLSAGYDGYYRESPAWIPIRATLHNLSNDTTAGRLVIKGAAPGASDYARDVILPAGATKDVAVYIPGTDAQGTVSASFRDGSAILASGAAYPNPIPDTDLIVGALTDEPDSVWWLRSVHPRHAHARVIDLSASTLDPVPDVLAGFDVIVLSNLDSSRLDTEQLDALDRYVRNGGSMVIVGGLAWQSTLASLPASLVPGRIVGTRTERNLNGLASLGTGTPPRHISSLSVLASIRGAVLSSQSGVPLTVKSGLGNGLVEYLAFDPASAPIAGWKSASPLLTSLIAGSAPLAMRRPALQPVDRASSFLIPGLQSLDISSELANFPTPPFPLTFIEPLIVAGAVLLTAVVTIAVLRRRRLVWLLTPIAAGLVGLLALHVAPTFAGRAALLNTLNTVYLDGPGPTHPADRYIGLFAPVGGDYHLQWNAAALGRGVSSLSAPLYGGGAGLRPPNAESFGEGAETTVSLPRTAMWTTRTVALHTNVAFQGDIDARLHLDRMGDLVGTVRNRTDFSLLEPAVIAGRAYKRLGALGPGAQVRVRIHPVADVQDHEYPQMLTRIYGERVPDYGAMVGRHVPTLPGSPAGLPPERSLQDRITNAVNTLPEGHVLSTFGQVTLVAWSDRPLGDLTLQGAHPSHRDLTLFIKPISVTVPPGRFVLPEGVLAARPVEVVPERPVYPCCGPTVQPISIGPGGTATFAFDVSGLRIARLTHLSLDIYAGGADPTASGYEDLMVGAVSAFDWRAKRWTPLPFTDGKSRLAPPARYISQTGALLVRLHATNRTGDLTILDPHQDMQLSGDGIAG